VIARGVTDNADLLGGDLHHVAGVESVLDCRAACAAASKSGCAAFTLSKATGFCWLKNSSYTPAAQNRTKGLISGLMAPVPAVSAKLPAKPPAKAAASAGIVPPAKAAAAGGASAGSAPPAKAAALASAKR